MPMRLEGQRGRDTAYQVPVTEQRGLLYRAAQPLHNVVAANGHRAATVTRETAPSIATPGGGAAEETLFFISALATPR